jgi:hypothetical protein
VKIIRFARQSPLGAVFVMTRGEVSNSLHHDEMPCNLDAYCRGAPPDRLR